MNMQQPDPKGLFEPLKGQARSAPGNNSVMAQIANRPVPDQSLPPVQTPSTPSTPAPPTTASPTDPVSQLIALSQSGEIKKLRAMKEAQAQAADPVQQLVSLSQNGTLAKMRLGWENQQYEQQQADWQKGEDDPFRTMGSGGIYGGLSKPEPKPPTRAPEQIASDWQKGVQHLRGNELGNILNQIETGQLTPEQEGLITQHIEPQLNTDIRKQLQTARLTRDDLQALNEAALAEEQQAKSFEKESLFMNPYQLAGDERFGQHTQRANVLGRNTAESATLNYAFAPDEEKLNSDDPAIVAAERAQRLFYLQQDAKYPVTALAGNILGAAPHFVLGGNVIRWLRAGAANLGLMSTKGGIAASTIARNNAILARGAAPTTTAGIVAEGAVVGLPYDLASRPEGSEDMSLKENIAARGQRAGFGVAMGVAGDLALTKGIPLLARGAGWTGGKISGYVDDVVEKQQKKQLDKTSQSMGFKDFDELADVALEEVTDETGSRIRLKQSVYDMLTEPDKDKFKTLLYTMNPETPDVPGSAAAGTAEPTLSRAEQDRPDETQFPSLQPESEPGRPIAPGAEAPTPPRTAEPMPGPERSATGEAEEVVPGRTEPVVREEPLLPEAPPGSGRAREVAEVDAPIDELTLSNDVPQFKSDANEKGVVEALTGTFDPRGVGPIQVWVRSDGRKEVISGRHRLDLARRSGEKTIKAQYYYEADGFDAQQAASLDAILNIREGQGKVKDYVEYIRGSGLSEEAAHAEGILGRATGQRAYTIANDGSDTLITAHRNNRLSDEAATRIANAAPGDERLQAVGIKAIEDGKSITVAENMVKAVRSMSDDTTLRQSGDMFGFDDSAIKEAEALARKAAAKQTEIQKTLSAVQGAAKNPALAAKEGVDISDPAALNQRITDLKQQKEDWQNWHTNPALVAELRSDLGLSPTVRSVEPEPVIEPTPRAEVSEDQGGFFDEFQPNKEFDLTQPTVKELEAKAKAEQDAIASQQKEQADLEAKARADTEAKDFELGLQGSGKDVSANQGDMLGLGGRSAEEPLSTQPSLKSEAETGGKTPEAARQQELDTIAKQQATDPLPGTSLYSTPFIPAAKQVASLLRLNPGGSVGGAIYGGIEGGDRSEAERYSPQWWLDSVFGAAGGATVGALGFSAVKKIPIKGRLLIGEEGWGSQSLKFLKAQINKVPGLGTGDADIVPLKQQQKVMQALIERQAEKAGQYLLDNFTPSQRAYMADLIEQRGIIAEGNLLHRQAKELDDFIAYTGKKLQELGMLDETIELGAYMHRYYEKDLGLGGLMRGLMPGGKTMSGSWSRRRGTQEVYNSNYFSSAMRDTLDQVQSLIRERSELKGKRGDLIGADTQTRIDEINRELKDLQSIEFREYMAPENGKLKPFFMHPDEVPVIPGMTPRQQGLPELTDRRWTIDAKKGDKEGILHRDYTKAEREGYGEIEDAAYRMVRGQAEVAHDLSLGIFFKQVNDRFMGSKVSDTEIEGWIQVPTTKIGTGSRLNRYGALAGKYVTPEVMAAIKHHGRNPLLNWTNNSPAVKNYLGLLGKWKKYKTVYNPVSHMNNVVSNLGMYYMSDYSPKYLASSMRELLKGENSALVREARDNGLFGTDYTSTIDPTTGNRTIDELLEKLHKQPEIPDMDETLDTLMQVTQWFIESKSAVKNAQGPWKTGAELAKAVGNPLVNTLKKPINKASNAMQTAYRMEDEYFKMAVYLAERQKGTKPFDAVTAANKHFFDYSDLPTAAQVVRDSPLGSPFISYTYFAIPAIARTAVERPEKLFAFAAFLEGVNYAGQAINGELQDQGYWERQAEDDEVLPDYMKSRSIWGGLNNITLPFVDDYKMGLGNMLPAGNPFIGNANRTGAWPEALSFWGGGWYGSNPIAVLLNDITTNTDWRGNPIWDEGSPDPAEKVRKATNYIYQNLTPQNPLWPGSYSNQKILEGAANEVREAKEAGEQPNALLDGMLSMGNATAETLGAEKFTGLDRRDNEILMRISLLGAMGIKLRPVRMDQLEESKQYEVATDQQKLGKWMGKKEKSFSENRISEDQIYDYRDQFKKANKEYKEQSKRVKQAAR